MNEMAFALPFTQQFFSGYLVDHFPYKLAMLDNSLRMYSQLKPVILDGIKKVDDAEYEKSVRLEIRATYFQAMETLFELIFSLEPRTSVVDNRLLWYYLSTAQWRKNYKRIGLIAEGDTSFLDRTIRIGKNFETSFIEYLFYYGAKDPKMLEAVRPGFESIKKFIVAFAKEFSDRGEYNAFKHALRAFPAMMKIEAIQRATQKRLITWDLSRSISYLTEGEDRSLTLETRPLDTERDMRMGQTCSLLISNIVRSRKAQFVKGYEAELHIFSDDIFPLATKKTVNMVKLKMTLKLEDTSPSKGSRRAGT